jgi:Skp family chaperone for outer membrane proteins
VRKRYFCFLMLCVLFACGLGGCSEKTFEVGYINSDKLLLSWTKYKNYGEEYMKDMEELRKKDPTKMNEQEKLTYMQDSNALKEKWDKIKGEVREQIRLAANEVASKKRLALILDNSNTTPTIEYGGTDVTDDVLKLLEASPDKGSKK